MDITAIRDGVIPRVCAGAACALIAAGAILGGMDKAASAALFGAALAGLLTIAVLLLPRERLAAAAKINAVPIAAGAVFILWSLFTAWLEPIETAPEWRRTMFHFLWAQFDSPNGAVSISPFRTLEGVAAFIGPAAAFLLGAFAASDRRGRDLAGRALMAGCAALGVWALYLQLTTSGAASTRLMAPFGSSNAAATMFGVLALVIAALILRAARGRLSGVKGAVQASDALALVQKIPITLAAFALALACLLLTGSRAGIMAFAGALVLLFALTRTSAGGGNAARQGQAAIGLVALLAAVLLLLGGDFIASRFGTFGVDAEGRRLMIETHWNAFVARPILGHGLNTFHELNAYYADVESWPALRDIGAAHNIFVQMLEETGLIGAGLFMLMLAPPLARALQIAVEARSGSEWAAAAFAAAAFAFAHGLVDFGLQVPSVAAALAFVLGAFSSGKIEGGKRRKGSDAPSPPPEARAPADFGKAKEAA